MAPPQGMHAAVDQRPAPYHQIATSPAAARKSQTATRIGRGQIVGQASPSAPQAQVDARRWVPFAEELTQAVVEAGNGCRGVGDSGHVAGLAAGTARSHLEREGS